MLALKVGAAIVLLAGLIWVLVLQESQPFLRRLALGIVGLAIVLALFAFVVSLRCDLGWLPADEC